MAKGHLRNCPTCNTSLDDVDLGVLDYRWLHPYLPGKIRPSDIDFVLDNEAGDSQLIVEWKPRRIPRLSLGQRFQLRRYVRRGFEVYVVSHEDFISPDRGYLWVAPVDRGGKIGRYKRYSVRQFGQKIERWWKKTTDAA